MGLENPADVVYRQVKETVAQEQAGVTVRLATITCPCGWNRSIMYMYQCLYCKVWFCQNCAEVHFGKTIAEYRAESACTSPNQKPVLYITGENA